MLGRTPTAWTSRSNRSTSTSSSSPRATRRETRAGLILPASAAQAAACSTGIVTAIGADVTGIEPGDKVLYPREAGFEVRLGGIEVKVVKRDDLIARIHD